MENVTEPVLDTAKVLGSMFDAIEFRGDRQADVEALAEYSGVPVFNGLTDEWHPTQMLADALTIREHVNKPFNEVTHVFMGDGRFNALLQPMRIADRIVELRHLSA